MRSSSALRLNRLGCALAACAAAFIVNSAVADTASVGLPAPWVSTATKALPPVASIARTPVDAAMPVHLIVSLQLRDKAALQTFIHNQHTPGNPQYGTVMTTAQFLAAHAPTADQAQAVRDYLAQAGFHNIRIATNRTLVSADGSAAAAQSAFNTQLVRYQVGGRTVFSNTSDAQVPAGTHQVRMEFGYDGGGLGKGGTVSLYLDGAECGEGRVEGTVPLIFSADETCDVGSDTASPVSDDYTSAESRFTGTVEWVQIDLDEAAEDLDHLITPEERLHIAMARQ